MKKSLLLSLAAAGFLTCNAQEGKAPCWLDLSVNRVNTMEPRSDFFAYESIDAAQKGDKKQSSRYLSLEGKWKFKFVKDHNLAPKDFFTASFDDSSWEEFPVPGLFELNGHGDATYKNIGYAWATQFTPNPPYQGVVATEENETAEVCIDELPYTWKWLPTPLSAAGEYEYVERNINGCDSVRHTLTLTTQDCGPCTVKIYRKWTDFLFIDNSASLYTAYQWYCNEQAIEGATAQYFRIGEPYKTTDAYYCLLTDSKGGTTKSCPATFDEAEASATLYPAGAGKTEVARRVYVVSPNFRLVVTLFDDGSAETEKQIRF